MLYQNHRKQHLKTKKQNQMARQKNNAVMQGTHSMVEGQIVFKRRAGKGYVAAAPEEQW